MTSKLIKNLLKEYHSEFEGFSKNVKMLLEKFHNGHGYFENDLDNPVLNKTLEVYFEKLVKQNSHKFEDNYLYSFGDEYGEDALKYIMRHEIPMEDVVFFMFLDSKGARKLSDVLNGMGDEERIKYITRGSSLANYVYWELWTK